MNVINNIETDRLWIVPMDFEDSQFLISLFNSPKWLKYIGDRNLKTVDDAKAYISNRILPQRERLGFSNFVLHLKENGEKIGICGLFERDGLENIDIGFALLPDYEGHGYALEAAKKIMKTGFEDLGLGTIVAITTKDNFASQRILVKLGMILSGTTRIPGDDEELLFYKIHKNLFDSQSNI